MQSTYTQVPNSEIEEQGLSFSSVKPHRLSIPWSPSLIITVLSLLFNVVLVIAWLRSKEVGGLCREAVYCEFISLSLMCAHHYVTLAPANLGLENSPTKFHSFYAHNQSVYDMPPSPEVDAAWEALYAHAGIRLTKEEAAKLPNNTWPIHEASKEDGYLGALYVFHELHCLDLIRQKFYGSHYNITYDDDSTIRYCLSGLRQSVMCSADTSVIVWQWSDAQNRALERSDILHSCKNFTNIQEWARHRYVDVNGLDLTSNH